MQIYGATDIGTMRQSNQDAFFNTVLSSNTALSIICDGMGGANAGNVASGIAINTISEYIKRSFVPDMKPSSIKNLLCSAIDSANLEILSLSRQNSEYDGMGTTAVVAFIVGRAAYIAHVGDSRAYIISNDEITQLTTDHSMIQSLIENGHLSPDEARFHPKRNIITRAIGIMDSVSSDFIEIDLTDKVLLMCTDGISNAVSPETMLRIVKENELSEVPGALITLANNANSGDNVTVTAVSLK